MKLFSLQENISKYHLPEMSFPVTQTIVEYIFTLILPPSYKFIHKNYQVN